MTTSEGDIGSSSSSACCNDLARLAPGVLRLGVLDICTGCRFWVPAELVSSRCCARLRVFCAGVVLRFKSMSSTLRVLLVVRDFRSERRGVVIAVTRLGVLKTVAPSPMVMSSD